VTEPNRDVIPAHQSFVRSDTGELIRDWKNRIETINTPKTRTAQGWIGAKVLQHSDATFRITTRKAVVALAGVDNLTLSNSHQILVRMVVRAAPSTPNRLAYLSSLRHHHPAHQDINL
jgi:hypothetical protein